MTPAEIEAEARRLQDVWGEALATTGDHGASWLAIAVASLRAREDVRRERDDARRWGYLEVKKEYDLIAPDEERERAALQARAEAEGWGEHGPAAETVPEDVVAADVAEAIRETSGKWPARSDHERLSEAHARIASLPSEKQGDAMRRLSRSYSAPQTCVEHDGCRREGDEIVWPDGERWPTRTEGT